MFAETRVFNQSLYAWDVSNIPFHDFMLQGAVAMTRGREPRGWRWYDDMDSEAADAVMAQEADAARRATERATRPRETEPGPTEPGTTGDGAGADGRRSRGQRATEPWATGDGARGSGGAGGDGTRSRRHRGLWHHREHGAL